MFKKIVVVAGIIFSASAFAQSENFSGASVGFNTGYESNQFRQNSTNVSLGAHSYPLNINGSYTFALSPRITVATGLTYDLRDATAASYSSGTFKLKNHYSLNIEPGYALTENTLGYLKVAYHSATSSISGTSATYTKSMTGIGYGFGTKHKLDKNLFVNLEVQQVFYNPYTPNSNVTSGTITQISTLGTFGFGYQF